jgi:hypothetical protein
MELALLAILMVVIRVLGKEAYITASGLHGLHLVKNLTPRICHFIALRFS